MATDTTGTEIQEQLAELRRRRGLAPSKVEMQAAISAAEDAGMAVTDIATALGVSRSALYKIYKLKARR